MKAGAQRMLFSTLWNCLPVLRLIEMASPLSSKQVSCEITHLHHLRNSVHTKIWYILVYEGSFRSSAVHLAGTVSRRWRSELLCYVWGYGKCAAKLEHLFKSVPDTSSWQSHPERQSFRPLEIEKARVTLAIKRKTPAHASSAFIKQSVHTLEPNEARLFPFG